MEPAKPVPIRRGTMPQQHAWVGLHRLATLRLRWTPNNEAYCERVSVDLLRRRHFRITPSTWCGLQLAAETKFEIVKANDNNNTDNLLSRTSCREFLVRNASASGLSVGGRVELNRLSFAGGESSRNCSQTPMSSAISTWNKLILPMTSVSANTVQIVGCQSHQTARSEAAKTRMTLLDKTLTRNGKVEVAV